MVTGVVGPGSISGRVQGVGSDHWSTRSQPWAGLRMGWPLKARRSLFPDWLRLCTVMSHHLSPHRRALHTPVLILAGKFKIEFLLTVGHWKGFPVAQICPNSNKIVFSCLRAFPVAQICQISHKIVFSFVRAFLVAQIRPNLHEIVPSCIKAFPVEQTCPNSHKIVSSCLRAFPVAQICHKIVFSYTWAFQVAQIRPSSH